MRDEPRFTEHDTTLNLWLHASKEWPHEPPELKAGRDALIKHLRARGFKMGLCERTKKHYKSIAHNHHRGAKGALEVRIQLCGRSLEILFFQNLVAVNRSGGEYDFGKRAKMPYLVGKQFELERRKISTLFYDLGLPGLQLEVKRTGMEFINHRRAELEAFQGKGFYDQKRQQDYNRKSASGALLSDGDRVCMVDRMTGRPWIGTTYANINNMWWVSLPGGEVRNAGSHELAHTGEPGLGSLQGRYFSDEHRESRLRATLERAVKEERYERAAVLRDVIRGRSVALKQAA